MALEALQILLDQLQHQATVTAERGRPQSDLAPRLIAELSIILNDRIIMDRVSTISSLPPLPGGGSKDRCDLCGCNPSTCS